MFSRIHTNQGIRHLSEKKKQAEGILEVIQDQA